MEDGYEAVNEEEEADEDEWEGCWGVGVDVGVVGVGGDGGDDCGASSEEDRNYLEENLDHSSHRYCCQEEVVHGRGEAPGWVYLGSCDQRGTSGLALPVGKAKACVDSSSIPLGTTGFRVEACLAKLDLKLRLNDDDDDDCYGFYCVPIAEDSSGCRRKKLRVNG